MGVVGAQVVLVHQAACLGEAHACLAAGLEERAHDALVVGRDAVLQHHDVVEIGVGGVGEHGVDCGGEHGDVVVVGREDHGDRGPPGLRRLGLLKARRGLGMLKVHALDLLALPSAPRALGVHEEDVEQAFGQVTGGAQRLSAVVGHVGLAAELLQDGEEPGAVLVEDLAPHHEHVAEAALRAGEEGVGVLRVVGVFLLEDGDDAVEVLDMQAGRRSVLLVGRGRASGERGELLDLGGHNVPALDGGLDGLVGEAVLLLRLRADAPIHDLAEGVFLVAGVGKVEVPAVMAETHVGRVGVFPGPVLRCELAVLGVEMRDVLSCVILQAEGEALGGLGGAHLHGLQDVAGKGVHRLVRAHEDADVTPLEATEAAAFSQLLEAVLGAAAQADEAGVPVCGLPRLCGEPVGPGKPIVCGVCLVERLALAQSRLHAVACEAEELGGTCGAPDGVGEQLCPVGLCFFRQAGEPGICQGGRAALACGMQAGLCRGAVPGAEPRLAGVDAAGVALAEGLELLEREGGGRLVLGVRVGEGTARDGVRHVCLAGKYRHLVDVLRAVEALGRHRCEGALCERGGEEMARDAPRGIGLIVSGAKVQLNAAFLKARAVAGRGALDICAKAEHVAACFTHASDELLEHGGLELIGPIEEKQVVAACALDASHAAQVDALAMGLLEHLEARVALGGALGNVGRAVFGGVVHHDRLEVAEGLRRQTGDATGQLVGDIARGDHNRDSGHGAGPSSKPAKGMFDLHILAACARAGSAQAAAPP